TGLRYGNVFEEEASDTLRLHACGSIGVGAIGEYRHCSHLIVGGVPALIRVFDIADLVAHNLAGGVGDGDNAADEDGVRAHGVGQGAVNLLRRLRDRDRADVGEVSDRTRRRAGGATVDRFGDDRDVRFAAPDRAATANPRGGRRTAKIRRGTAGFAAQFVRV